MFDDRFNPNTLNFNTQAAKKIAELFPTVVTDGRIDIDKLKEIIASDAEDIKSDERYEFTWHGKKAAKHSADMPTSKTTLIGNKNKSKNWANTKNVYIEGDNLEVLRLLQKAYSEKVKMIYLDPPYNTGKDFIYHDNYYDSYENYLRITGQINEDGHSTTTNKETNGRFHTDWLNMMYPRLKLARNLLKEDGLIFVSIDDNEVKNLKSLMDEIFGENNFEGQIHWRRRKNQPNDKHKLIGLVAEHILVYAKNSTQYKISGVGKIPLTGKFSNPDSDPNGPWNSKPWKAGSTQGGSKYEITYPSGKKVLGTWMGSESTYKELYDKGIIYFPKDGDGEPRKKIYKKDRLEEGQSATNWWNFNLAGSNEEASKDLADNYFNKQKVFSNPKPVQLVKLMISLSNLQEKDIVVDFFSGSGTTAESVMATNANELTDYKYVLVQLPENLDESLKTTNDSKAKIVIENAIRMLDDLKRPHNLAEVAEERIRRAGDMIADNADTIAQLDIGFRVYELSESTIREWDDNPDQFEHQIEMLNTTPFKDFTTTVQQAEEIALKSGITLDADYVSDSDNEIFHYTSDDKELFVVLSDNYDAHLLELLLKEQSSSLATVVIKEQETGSEVKFNIIEQLKQNPVLANRFNLEWL